jgi:Anti-sigma-K factor rskA
MKEPENLDDLIGEDVSPEELARLERVDSLLRAVPAPPPELPASLTRSIDTIGLARSRPTRRRLGLAAAFAAVLAAAAFGFGRWTAEDGFDARAVVAMQPTNAAPEAAAVIEIGELDDASGNWRMQLEVSGLPSLPGGRSYHLWLAKDGEYAASCGYFNVGPGTTRVDLTVAYSLQKYDAWVITESGGPKEGPWLLRAGIKA